MIRVLSACLLAILVSTVAAQDAAAVRAELDLFQAEKTKAAQSYTPAEIAPAEELAKRAETALKDGNLTAAARLTRDARWNLPFVPANLPANVSRVLGVSRLRHGDRVNALAYSPDGTKLASASRDGTVRIWNLGNGHELLAYRGHADTDASTNPMRVPGLAFRPDGKAIASCGGKEIHIWDSTTGKLLHTLNGHTAPARGLAFLNDTTLISGGDDRKVIVWDVAKEKPTVTYPEQSQRVEAIAIGAKGKLLASVNAAGELTVYPLGSEKTAPLLAIPVTDGTQIGLGVAFAGDSAGIITCGADSKLKLTSAPDPSGTPIGGGTVRTYSGHDLKVNALGVTPDGKLLVSGANDKTVRVWDIGSGKQLFLFSGHSSAITALAVRPDGKQAASGSEDGSIRLWPLGATDEHRSISEAADSLWSVAVSPDGKHFASAGADRTVRIYGTDSGKLEKALTGHNGAIPALAFVGNDRLASASGDKTVKVWNLADGSAKDLVGHGSAVLCVSADSSGKILLSGSVDKTVRSWDPDTGKSLWTWTGKSAVCGVAVRGDGKLVAVGTADGGLTILAPRPVGDPQVVGTISAHGAGVASATFHPAGAKLATAGGDGAVRIWSVSETAQPVPASRFEPPVRAGGTFPVTAISISNDGKLLACGGADTVTRIWDFQTGNEVRGFRGHTDWVTGVAFAADGKSVFSVGVDKAVRTFELVRNDTITAGGHTQPARCVAVSRDGKYAATGSADGTAKVWDLAAGREVGTLTGSTAGLNAVGFDSTGRVVAGGEDQRVRTWEIAPVKEIGNVPAGGPVFNLAPSADGKRIAIAWVRGGEKYAGFEVQFADGTAPILLTEKDRTLSCAVLAADGTLAVSGGQEGVVRLWDLQAKDRIGADWPIFVKAIADLALTPDKKTLVAIDVGGTVKIADVAKRAAGEAIKAITGDVNGLVMSPTGDRFATLAADGTVKAWDMTGKELRSWKLPVPAAAAAFAPGGKKIVTGNADGTGYILDLP